MKRLINRLCIGMLVVGAIQACKQSDIAPIVNDGVAPGAVTGVTVTNLSGAATLKYSLPSDPDVLYVTAVYKTKQGVERETKVSYYNNTITVVGFADTDPYEVKLYAVDKGGNISQPTSVTVNPLIPPYKVVRNSLKAIANFGGIDVSFQNATEADIAMVVIAPNALGDFTTLNTNYTTLKQGMFMTRDLKAEETKFGVYVRDRWGNISDTLNVTLTPIYEERLDRTKMKALVLQTNTDSPTGYGGSIAGLFDGSLTGGMYHTGDAGRMPQWFTYDMGVSAKLSRMSWWMRQGFYYNLHSPRKVEIWGSNNPSPNGSFDGWVKLTDYEQIKPSGLPNGQLSTADNDAANAGETITIPLDAPKVRYIRFKTLSNWSSGTYVQIFEIAMWGNPQ
ncbi:protein of unknown function [Pedobacter steynii]|uniref:Fibronectin type-III domain-containing protein n=1 Tax=Pedobacter steynii TaxID=430522 RepID=A0A1G9JLW8_9SPHI|nr:DUF5000 domain-containing lipoprotein [Pedobacter steynii]NQX38298.1 DUF4959 domain-containing protein [Pedobacter steynii]SDL38600.1 protein of unknown function [Pedobacter steynii]